MTFLDLAIFAQMGGRGGGAGAPSSGAIIGALLVPLIIGLIGAVIGIACWWKIFTKAGEPGWAAIVPVYQGMIWAKICGRGEMFGLLLLVPCVNIIIAIMLVFDTARVFGKGGGFAVGLLLLGIVFLPILAFGDAQYVGDRPSRGRRRRDDDDDDDRPRRRRVDDDDDDQPRRRPAADDRVRRRPDDDDDDRPRRRPAARDDDPPARPRRPAPRDDDDDPPPRPRAPRPR